MTIEQLVFDENMETYIKLPNMEKEVCLCVSDDLFAYEEEWTEEYKTTILDFVNSFSTWMSVANKAVLSYGKQTYNVEATEKDLRLMNVYILFEQNEPPLFGLQYRTEYDVEHGCGLKIKGNSFEITEIGCADVSFC